jgi:hypothetical protein
MKDMRSEFGLSNRDYPDYILKGVNESLQQAE